jgi:plasmid stability protein
LLRRFAQPNQARGSNSPGFPFANDPLDGAVLKHHDVFIRTTLNISDALLAELRSRANETGRPMNATIEEVLQRGLSAETPRRKPAKVRTFRIGVKPAYLGMSMNQIYDQLEAESTLKVAEK